MQKKWRTVITSSSRLLEINLKEVWMYRDLCIMFMRKNYITRYKQTILGPLYMILSPLLTSGLFSVIFGMVAGISTDGIPNFLFYMSGNITWAFFSGCVMGNSNTFVGNAYIMGKVYFPRLIIPLSNTFSKMMNLLTQLIIFIVIYLFFLFRGYIYHPSLWLIAVPFLLLMIGFLGVGIGLIVSSLTIKYRDLNVILSFALNLLMYASPVIYPISNLKGIWRSIALLNPIATVIETVRYAFFGVGVISVTSILLSMVITFLLLFIGVILFNKVEKTFIDTV